MVLWPGVGGVVKKKNFFYLTWKKWQVLFLDVCYNLFFQVVFNLFHYFKFWLLFMTVS